MRAGELTLQLTTMLPIRVDRLFWLYHKDARGCEQVNNGDNDSIIEDVFCEGYVPYLQVAMSTGVSNRR